MGDGTVELLQRVAQGAGDARASQRGIDQAEVDLQRGGVALRAAEQRGQRRMFFRGEPVDADLLDDAVERCALESPPQALAQGGEMLAAEQALEPGIDRHAHSGANLRSGSSSRILARPSQVHRETKTASMPSRRCSWQMATPGSSA